MKKIIALLLGCAAMLPTFKKLWQESDRLSVKLLQNILAVIILYLSFAFLCGATYNPFIYFRF